jgi:hypothetical protein
MRLFKKDLQDPVIAIIRDEVPSMIETVIGNMVPHMIEAAVLKGQLELLDILITNSLSTDLGYLSMIKKDMQKQLDHIATTEAGERSEEI